MLCADSGLRWLAAGTTVSTRSHGVGQPEVHAVTTGCIASLCTLGGSFVLGLDTVSGVFVTTTNIPFNADAATVKTAVESAFR
jgi:hypothetical protein